MKLEISRQIFEKPSNIKFNENASSGRRVIPSGQTDGQAYDKTNSRLTQFFERA
jgi:hypothetical protein